MVFVSKLSRVCISVGLALIVPNYANASVISLEFSNAQYIADNSLKSGIFDLSGFMQQQKNSGFDVNLNSANFRVAGYSNEQQTQTVSTYVTSSAYYNPSYYSPGSCSWWGGCYSSYYSPSWYSSYAEYNNHVGDGLSDVLLVDFGDQDIELSTSNPDSYMYSQDFYYYGSNSQSRTLYNYYNRNDFGNVSAEMILSSLNIESIMNEHILNFSYSVKSGHYNNLNFYLDVNYDIAPTPFTPTVASPATISIFGLGLVGLAAANRRRYKKHV